MAPGYFSPRMGYCMILKICVDFNPQQILTYEGLEALGDFVDTTVDKFTPVSMEGSSLSLCLSLASVEVSLTILKTENTHNR
jgi:hypothetical protein